MNRNPLNVTGQNEVISTIAHLGYAALGFVLSMEATFRRPWLLDRVSCRNVGRYRIGEPVAIVTRCVPGGIPIQPLAPGRFRLYGGDIGVRSGRLPIEVTDQGNVGIFRGKFVADNSDHVGRYIGLIAFEIGSPLPVEECFFFDIIPGGHQLGTILSLFGVDRPAGAMVLASCESGKITQGHFPYLDEGV